MAATPVEELLARRGPGVADGAPDAPAGRGDLLVALARHAHLELGGPVAAEHHVRVALDHARHHDPAAGVDDPGGRAHRDGRLQVGVGAEPDDAASRHRQGAVGDDAQGAGLERPAAARTSAAGASRRRRRAPRRSRVRRRDG